MFTSSVGMDELLGPEDASGGSGGGDCERYINVFKNIAENVMLVWNTGNDERRSVVCFSLVMPGHSVHRPHLPSGE